jgi:hypothetical protein
VVQAYVSSYLLQNRLSSGEVRLFHLLETLEAPVGCGSIRYAECV